jgi:DNA end-binding protein Ku
MPRPSFKGFIRLSLVSVPVEGYTASAAGEAQISLNQLHDECHSRIRYKKTCPEHGEVDNSEIVMGYEYEKDHYAVIDPHEIDALRSEADRSINIDRFVDPSTIDPRYYAGRTYYLMPQGAAGEKPYALLHRALVDENVVGLGQVVISNREQLVALRPLGKLLAASVLQYSDNVKPTADFEDELDDAKVSPQELKLAKTLIAALRERDPDLEHYRDLYNDRLRALVDAKVEGREVARPPQTKAPPTINLIDALKRSLDVKRTRSPARKPARTTRRAAPAKKRKTG